MKDIGLEWKALDAKAKEPYIQRAQIAKDKYKEEMTRYKKQKFEEQEKNKKAKKEEEESEKGEESIKEEKEFEILKKAFLEKKAKRKMQKQQTKATHPKPNENIHEPQKSAPLPKK